jgi:hypothetical protein
LSTISISGLINIETTVKIDATSAAHGVRDATALEALYAAIAPTLALS